MPNDCFLCNRIAQIKSGENPFFVTELESGYVVLGDFQEWRGYALLLCKECKPELHDLSPSMRTQFLADMALLAEAVWNVFKPAKLNYEALGNLVQHLHWHIFPRYADEPDRTSPVWLRYKAASEDPKNKLSPAEMEQMKAQLRAEIERLQRA